MLSMSESACEFHSGGMDRIDAAAEEEMCRGIESEPLFTVSM